MKNIELIILYVMERLFKNTGKTCFRVASFLKHFHAGRTSGYPTCCVAHFAWNSANPKYRQAKRYQGVERGAIFAETDKVYVPCGYHKGRHPAWTPHNAQGRRQLRLFPDQIGRS